MGQGPKNSKPPPLPVKAGGEWPYLCSGVYTTGITTELVTAWLHDFD
jgi:hypothetical protein